MQRKHRPFGRQSQLPSGTLTTMLGESDFSNSRLTRRRHGMNAMVSTELTSRWVCVSGGDFSAEIDAQRRIIAGIQFAGLCHGNSIEHALRAKARQASCRCDGILPLCGSFGPDDPQCGSGDEVALQIAGTVDGGVHAEEALGGSSRLEPLHLALSRRTG